MAFMKDILTHNIPIWEECAATPFAVESAKAYVTMAIEHSLAIGKGCGPTHHFYELYQHGLSKE